jgi:putative spermidine/putrescine transport system permease protein
VVLIVSAALDSVSISLERAAMILGASPLRALREVTLPIIAPALAAGALFGFITSFDESVISLFLSTITTSTLPKVMWDSLRFEISPTISAIAALLVGLSTIALVISAVLIGRKSPGVPG